MSQSRKKGNKYKVTIPCKYERGGCLKEAKTNFQIIPCENSGRVRPQITNNYDESPVI